MPKRIPNDVASAGNTTMSREDRKIEQTIRIFQKAEERRLKREEKRKLAVINKTGGNKQGGGQVSQSRGKQKHVQHNRPPTRVHNNRVQIHIMFADKVHGQNASNRYFFERKRNIEERQKLEQEEYWARMVLHRQQMAQTQYAMQLQNAIQGAQGGFNMQYMGNNLMFPSPSMRAVSQNGVNFMSSQAFGKYANAGETGGNFEGGEDYSGSSYVSSASKRNLCRQHNGDEEGRFAGQIQFQQQNSLLQPYRQFMNSQSLFLPPRPQGNISLNGLKEGASPYDQVKTSAVNGVTQNGNPTSENQSPLKNPISEEGSMSVSGNDNNKSGQKPVTLNIQLKQQQQPQPPEAANSLLVDPEQASNEQSEAQKILELTRQQMERSKPT